MELKLLSGIDDIVPVGSFNRTTMELKHVTTKIVGEDTPNF